MWSRDHIVASIRGDYGPTKKVVYFNNKCVPVLVGPRHFPGYIERHIYGPDIIKIVSALKGITKTFSLTFSKYP